ncbi:sporulation histidine kinase inhibitor Sda [Alteribacillus sp. JSM 102045]
METFYKAIEYNLDTKFIALIYEEINARGLKIGQNMM